MFLRVFFFINKAHRTARCKNSTHFSRVVYDQTMDQTAREKRKLQEKRKLRDGRVRLRIELEEKNILAKEQRTKVGRQLKTCATLSFLRLIG